MNLPICVALYVFCPHAAQRSSVFFLSPCSAAVPMQRCPHAARRHFLWNEHDSFLRIEVEIHSTIESLVGLFLMQICRR